jgi:hypothetical protein
MRNKKFLGCVLKDLSFIAREPLKVRVRVCSYDLPLSSTYLLSFFSTHIMQDKLGC